MVTVLRFPRPYRLLIGLGIGLVLALLARPSVAQQRPAGAPDTLASSSASQRPGGTPDASGGVEFSAADSLVILTRRDSADQGTLHGQAEMSYKGANLKAGTIEMNFATSVLRASGPPSDTAAQGRPTFERQDQSFTGSLLSYSLRTERGRVVTARTQQQQGFVEGQAVKVYEDSTLFVEGGSYTTCDCPPGETPSYSLQSDEMKVEGKWVYTGPIQLFLFNVPTPLWLPFGFLPNVQGRRSGPLAPTYGQDQRKGLFLRDWGWYFALNAYTDLQLRASVWSKGSFEINPIFRYENRYNYGGRVDLRYRRTRIGEEEDPDFSNQHEGQLRWSHDQTLSPTASIRGRVNLATSTDFARRSSNNYDDAVSQEISSNLQYSKNWPGGGKSFNISLNQRQQLQSGNVSLTFPSLSFSQRSFKPFDVQQAVGEDRWYEKITTSYNLSVDNDYSFRPRDPEDLRARGDSMLAETIERADIAWYEALVDRDKYQLATGDDEPFDFQATHQIPISASFRINRYNLSFSPNINYNSDWRISTTRRTVDLAPSDVDRDTLNLNANTVERTVRGFYARRSFSTGLSANTELFGLFPLRAGPLQGLRHRMVPSLSFNYQPNFNAPFWGRTRTLRFQDGTPVRDTTTGEPIRYDILGGNRVRGSTEQRTLGFSLDNELETKYVSVDTTGERQEEKIKLLDFDLNTSYNFTADSLKLSDIQLRARTTVRDFSIRSSMTFSPYALRPTGSGNNRRFRVVDRYMAAESPLTPVRLTRFRLNVGGSFEGGGGSQGVGIQQRPRSGTPGQTQRPPGISQSRSSTERADRSSSQGYLGTTLPWSLSFDFSYSFRKPRKQIQNQNATVNAQFGLDVTPKWSLEGRTGYDLIQNDIATTSINVSRDIGRCSCWVMSFSWVPFGARQSYGFNLQVKSGQLSQLLRLNIPNTGEGPLGGFGNRLRQTAGSVAGGGQGRSPF